MSLISIRHKLTTIYLLVVVEIFAVLLLTRHFWTIPQFLSLEEISDQKDINRIANIVQSKIDELALVNYDNAVWSDSFDFVNEHNQEFIEENFVIDTFQSLDINGLYYYDLTGNKVWGNSFDRDRKAFHKNPYFDAPPELFIQQLLFSKAERNKPATHKGIIFIDNKPTMFTTTTVMNSNATGASNGTLLFYRNITAADEKALSEQAETELNFIWPDMKSYQQHLAALASSDLPANRSKDNQLTVISYDFLNKTPYFIRASANERAFDNQLFDMSVITAFSFALLGILFLFHYVAKYLLKPILRWQQQLAMIVNKSDYDIRLTEAGNDELTLFTQKFNQLMDFIQQQNNEIKSQNIQLEKLSYTDGLTKVYNRRYFDNYLKELWQAEQQVTELCLCMIDIDFFKKYNDNYGHLQGDATLMNVAKILETNTKRSSDTVARYGGEEFVVILTNTSLENGLKVAESLRQHIEKIAIQHQTSPLGKITVSIGVSHCLPRSLESPEQLINLADEALYKAKDSGRNKVRSVDITTMK